MDRVEERAPSLGAEVARKALRISVETVVGAGGQHRGVIFEDLRVETITIETQARLLRAGRVSLLRLKVPLGSDDEDVEEPLRCERSGCAARF